MSLLSIFREADAQSGLPSLGVGADAQTTGPHPCGRLRAPVEETVQPPDPLKAGLQEIVTCITMNTFGSSTLHWSEELKPDVVFPKRP
jgi:hypothetical protein